MIAHVLDFLENNTLVKHSSKVMVVEGTRQLTFSAVANSAKKVASAIIAQKDVQKTPVIVYLPRGADIIIANLGVLYSGNFYCNIDTTLPSERMQKVISNMRPSVFITKSEFKDRLLELGVPEADLLLLDVERDVPAPDFSKRLFGVIDADPVSLINTSGSTGVPKSCVVTQRGIIDFVNWAIETFKFDSTTVIGNQSPFFFDIYLFELVLSLATGATINIIPAHLNSFPAELLKYMSKSDINFIFWVPTVMVNIANMDLLSDVSLSGIKKVWFAGEVFPTRHCNYWRRKLPQAEFTNLYGPIEISLDCTFYTIDRDFDDNEPLPIGRACRNKAVFILNDEGKLAAVNEQGELYVRGAGVAWGYWNNPEMTQKAFVQNPLHSHYPEPVYKTGDSVFENERGEIMFVGRRDFQIKHQGYRIELGDIENAALSLADIRNVCCVYNRDKKEIVLFYESDVEKSIPAFRTELGKKLPKYMVPTVYRHLARMPMNPNGKVDRNSLNIAAKGSD